MKGVRSHRLASTEPPDDWVNGSWTVDCSCGVTFDDGEEMVNCDECGVWVHTRCSRYVKGETSFYCDKCKKKMNRNDNNEETEVAQLLVELTSKTMRIDNFCRSTPSAPPLPRPAYRLWTEIPIEDRVHDQGVPGGDSSLFQGLSSVFNSELWKCSGYVPKKFNFQYREFPCWDDEKEEGLVDARIEEETDNIADRGANVLCSLWKDKPTEIEVSLVGLVEEADCEKKIGQKEKYSENHVKKDKTHLLTHAVHPSKQKEFVRSKERSGKKKARSAEKEADGKKRAFTPSVDERKVVCREDGGSKVSGTECQYKKKKIRMEVKSTETNGGCLDAVNNNESMKDPSTSKLHVSEHLSEEASRSNVSEHLSEEASRSHVSVEVVEISKKVNCQCPTRTGDSKTAAVSAFLTESSTVGGSLANVEDGNMIVHGSNHVKDENHEQRDLNGSSFSGEEDCQKVKSRVGDLHNDVTDVQDNHKVRDSLDVGASRSPVQCDTTELKKKSDNDQAKGDIHLLSSPLNVEKLEPAKLLEILAASINPSLDDKCQNGDREMKVVDHCHKSDTMEISVPTSGERHLHGEELESPLSAKETSLELKTETKNVEETSGYGGLNSDPRVKADQQKAVSAIGKSSTSPTIVFSRSSFSASSKAHETKGSLSTPRSIHSSKQQVKTNVDTKKDHPVNDVLRKGGRHDAERKTAKELPKVYSSSGSKASQTNKTTHVPSSKRMSHSKEQVPVPSSKTSMTRNVAVPSSSVESASSLHTQNTSHVQNKSTPFGSSLKGDRLSQSSSQPSQKLNHSPAMHPPAPVNSSPALSDEELALLLHQELNSSPRVPRVPRVRHGGTLPQLGSPTSASMLVKRTSSTSTKDQLLFSRRKREDASRESSRKPRERVDETKKEKLPSCLDQRRQDPQCTPNGSTKVEACNGSSHVLSVKKNVLPPSSTYTAIGGPSSSSEANDHRPSSVRSSSRDMSDDDLGAVMGPTPRTLPGLLDEIMSKGKRMSYEELCNAVLPHWHKLRKHNGERYAYTSHSQAVLDCLRNRNEWAQLVDRGPKTNASRKRRKIDSESLPIIEGVEDDFDKSNLKEVEVKYVESQREDYPKGKRKVRKRRRLSLQGRGIKDIRKKQNADVAMDEGDLSLSPQSSEGAESMFSEEESQGTKTGTTEALTSEDETGSML